MRGEKHVLIVESHETYRKGLQAVFAEALNIAQVHEAATSKELKSQLESQTFDLIVISQELITDITILPAGDFVVLAGVPDLTHFFAACTHGARAYLLKDASSSLLLQTLYLAQGAFLTDPAVAAWLVEYFTRHTFFSISDELLTPREREIFHLLWSGFSKYDIARQLHLSASTIKVHTSNIYEKLGLNRYQAKILSLLNTKNTNGS
jgi:DNA-binding NarL/FixJ family response regulator